MNETQLRTEIARFNAIYDRLLTLIEDVLAEIGETAGACGIWSPKQVLAHLDGWVTEANRQFDVLDAEQPAMGIPEENAFNAQSVTARTELSWDEQVAGLIGTVDTMSVRAAELPLERWFAVPGYWLWFDQLAEDAEEHYEQLRAFFARYTE